MMIAQGASSNRADHLERRRRNAGKKRNDVVKEPDLRLVEERPEITHDRRRKHHRDEDDSRPEPVPSKATVDEVGKREAQHGLQQDRPEQEMGGRLHRRPNVRIGEHRNVVVDADVGDRRIRPVGAIVRERKVDRPDQRKDVDREQQHDRRRDEEPGNDPIGQAPHAPRQGLGRGARCLVEQDLRVGRVHHRRIISATNTALRGRGLGEPDTTPVPATAVI